MTIQKPNLNKGQRVGVGPAEARADDWRKKNPVFSLQYTVPGYCVSNCDGEQKVAFANTLLQLGKRTWLQILQEDRHASGSEKVPRFRLKVAIPSHVTEDQEFFTAVRFFGKCPMIGYVQQGVYYIVWLDRDHSCY
jgi:hypothetical protein